MSDTEELLCEQPVDEECSSIDEQHTGLDRVNQPEPTFLTVEEAVEKLGFGPFQICITVVCGMIWLADAIELMLLSVLSPALKCQWNLSSSEEASITSIVFVGFLIGSLFWGYFCDAFGRKTGLFIVSAGIFVFGVLSAVPVSPGDDKVPGFGWLLFCRFGVGIFAGGSNQAVTYYSEYLPKKARGLCITFLEVWWAFGSMLGALLALGTMPTLRWHWYLGLSAAPLAIVLLFFPFVPESARYYVVHGKPDKAKAVIKRIAFFNCKKVPEGELVTLEEKQRLEASNRVLYESSSGSVSIESGSVSIESPVAGQSEVNPLLSTDDKKMGESTGPLQPSSSKTERLSAIGTKVLHQLQLYKLLLIDGMWKTSILLAFIWLGCAWLYYGVVLLTTSLLQYEPHCGIVGNISDNATSNATLCKDLTTSDYLHILWAATAELPGLFLTFILIELIGRKKTMAVEFILSMGGFLLLFICGKKAVIVAFLFLIRAVTTGVFQAVYVYTPEVFSTNIRAAALGVFSGSARVGAIVTPYVAQVLLLRSDYAAISLYAGSALLLSVAALLLPIETKGRPMTDQGSSI